MPVTPVPLSPCRDERYLARPLVLVAVLMVAGHPIRGSTEPAPPPKINPQEVVRHE